LTLDEKRSNSTESNYTARNEGAEQAPDDGKMQRQELSNTANKRQTKKSRLLANQDINRWYQNLKRRSKNTAEVRLRRMGKFCEEHNMTPMELVDIGLKDSKSIADLLQDHIAFMEEQNNSPQYIKSTMTAVKSLLSHFDISVKRKLMIANAESTPTLDQEKVPERLELMDLFMGASLRQGTIMSFMAKSGVRPQVLGSVDGTDGLTLGDFPELALVNGKWCFLDETPRFIVRKTLSKARHEYFSYMTKLSQQWFLAYLNDRMLRGESLNPQSPAVNPMTDSPYAQKQREGRFMMTPMVERDVRLAMRPKYNWRPYVLRSYFRTQLMICEINNLISHSQAEFHFGHVGDMSARYSVGKGVLPKQLLDTMKESFHRCEAYLDIEREVVIKESDEPTEMPKSHSILYGDKIQEVQKLDKLSELSQQTKSSDTLRKVGNL
jgi:hypothetical protein